MKTRHIPKSTTTATTTTKHDTKTQLVFFFFFYLFFRIVTHFKNNSTQNQLSENTIEVSWNRSNLKQRRMRPCRECVSDWASGSHDFSWCWFQNKLISKINLSNQTLVCPVAYKSVLFGWFDAHEGGSPGVCRLWNLHLYIYTRQFFFFSHLFLVSYFGK